MSQGELFSGITPQHTQRIAYHDAMTNMTTNEVKVLGALFIGPMSDDEIASAASMPLCSAKATRFGLFAKGIVVPSGGVGMTEAGGHGVSWKIIDNPDDARPMSRVSLSAKEKSRALLLLEQTFDAAAPYEIKKLMDWLRYKVELDRNRSGK